MVGSRATIQHSKVDELRELLIESVLETGGHLGSNLGVVELTVALHNVFSDPDDVIIWDVGHQAYVHKALTGRSDAFGTLRQAGGLAGYPSPAEDPNDVTSNSHASVGLSYAAGLAYAARLNAAAGQVVVVVGDGSLTGGVAFEALNGIGGDGLDVFVIINDNGRSYDPTVGGLSQHLGALSACEQEAPVFSALGYAFLGTVDGHDLGMVEAALRTGMSIRGPRLLHVLTQKGKGYVPAEEDHADHLHAVAPRSRSVGSSTGRTWTDHFGSALLRIAADNSDVVAITAAMRLATGLGPLSAAFPDRVIDVGIAEQHAVACAAGLARAGKRPVVAIYSTFLNRAFDQILMDVALHQLPVVFVADRAGITGPDGPSHHGLVDLAIARAVPGLTVLAPRTPSELETLLEESITRSGPTLLRFPKALANDESGGLVAAPAPVPEGVLVVGLGPARTLAQATARALAARGVQAHATDTANVEPLDPRLVDAAAASAVVVTIEDHWERGGFGTGLLEALSRRGAVPTVLSMSVPHSFIPHGPAGFIRRVTGADPEAIADRVIDQAKLEMSVGSHTSEARP